MTTSTAYLAQLDAWKQQRVTTLKAANGWLNIIGRWWLEPGTVSVGSAPDSDLVLSVGPAKLGTVTQDDSGVTFTPANGDTPIHIVPNKEKPPQFLLEGLFVAITPLNGETAIRLR